MSVGPPIRFETPVAIQTGLPRCPFRVVRKVDEPLRIGDEKSLIFVTCKTIGVAFDGDAGGDAAAEDEQTIQRQGPAR